MKAWQLVLLFGGLVGGCTDSGDENMADDAPVQACDDGSAPPCTAAQPDGQEVADDGADPDQAGPAQPAGGDGDGSGDGANPAGGMDASGGDGDPEPGADDPDADTIIEEIPDLGGIEVEYETLPTFEELCAREGVVAVALAPADEAPRPELLQHFMVVTQAELDAAKVLASDDEIYLPSQAGDHEHIVGFGADAAEYLEDNGTAFTKSSGFPPGADGAHDHDMQLNWCP